MTRVFITGSVDGLGRAAASTLIKAGHEVVLHARSTTRAGDFGELAKRAAAVVVGDLSSARETREVADQVNAVGPMDAVIHNAGVYTSSSRIATADGHAQTLAVNVLAPYILTASVSRPARLVYLSSGMHRSGDASLRDLDWTARRWSWMRAYSDSKLFVTALALAVARRWPEVFSNAVDPGWVPTKMGGRGAPDDLELGHRTQEWLATSEDPDAKVSGGYWFHQRRQAPAPAAADEDFQDRLLVELAQLTGVRLF
ncbi:SDR family NAD(P)-dependent oxidoreductase [Actinocrinis sp.]|uniref:SDR family NAD(P)-dependent oxidoreductase n=1 Tax=Actinocrinis sp. TaxID=1920516 RepID=UPI002D5C7826|nr:SDR family NAD(P)-dependent oxidoreductase [Actinocrinis sp.]HZP53761.1 SDR family NAD(P)-dependent oxidoreductase [Actinocrinis sp.]